LIGEPHWVTLSAYARLAHETRAKQPQQGSQDNNNGYYCPADPLYYPSPLLELKILVDIEITDSVDFFHSVAPSRQAHSLKVFFYDPEETGAASVPVKI
jgi:hypothetical protein